MCSKKWENLVRTYKTTKDKKSKTGRGPTRFAYFDRLDDLLGDSPTNSSPHSIDVNKTSITNNTVTVSSPSASRSPSPQQNPPKKCRKNPSMEYVKVKTGYYKKKEEERQKREERVENYLKENIRLKQEKLVSLNKKVELEERKVKALEKMAGISNVTD